MRKRGYPCGDTLEELWDEFRQDPAKAQKFIVAPLLKEGYTVHGICYAAGVAQEKLRRFIGDRRFYSIFQNEVRKFALKRNDPRWNPKKRYNCAH